MARQSTKVLPLREPPRRRIWVAGPWSSWLASSCFSVSACQSDWTWATLSSSRRSPFGFIATQFGDGCERSELSILRRHGDAYGAAVLAGRLLALDVAAVLTSGLEVEHGGIQVARRDSLGDRVLGLVQPALNHIVEHVLHLRVPVDVAVE